MIIIKYAKIDAFEKLVLIVGILSLVIGGLMINGTLEAFDYELTWDFLQTTFLWLILVIFIILLALSEDLKISVLKAQNDKMNKLIAEMKALRQDLGKKKSR